MWLLYLGEVSKRQKGDEVMSKDGKACRYVAIVGHAGETLL